MAEVLITSFFTLNSGAPATDIENVTPGFPTVRIWEVVDGTPTGDSFIGEFGMVPIEDGANDDGFYKFEFKDTDGYNEASTYIFRADGGSSLGSSRRYQVARLDPSLTEAGISSAVWDAQKSEHLVPGSQGESLSQTKADTTAIADQLYLGADSVLEVVQVLLKLEAGRTKIDPVLHTLTVYDEDCSTPLRVFELLDSTGTPSVTEVCERKPILKGAADGTTITDVCP